MPHSTEIIDFIKENKTLFWSADPKRLHEISLSLLVETILNYGNEKSVKKLFDLVGIDKVAEIFYEQTSRKRLNYHERTINFFNLYFKRHAQRDTHKRAV